MGNYFVAVKIPLGIGKKIFDRLKNVNFLKFLQGKNVNFENYHFTLRFFGELKEREVEEIVGKLKGISFKSFICKLNKLGVFDSKFNGVIWVGTSSEKLDGLAEEVFREVGREKRHFRAHSTVLRFKKILEKEKLFEKLGEVNFDDLDFLVDKFYLMKSELLPSGSKYHVVESFVLGK
jgi:RNA 2',3'-cyclic 3'-phosphodiesterase